MIKNKNLSGECMRIYDCQHMHGLGLGAFVAVN